MHVTKNYAHLSFISLHTDRLYTKYFTTTTTTTTIIIKKAAPVNHSQHELMPTVQTVELSAAAVDADPDNLSRGLAV